MDLNWILKTFSFLIDFLIMMNIFSPTVNSLPFLDEIKSRASNKDFLELLDQFEGQLGVSSEELINLQNPKGFDIFEGGVEQSIKLINNRLQNLFVLPFLHPIVQDTKNASEIYRGDCLAPNNCFTKKQGSNLCTMCEEDMSAATELIEFFREAKSTNELLDMGEKCKHVLNEYLFNYALTYLLISKFPDIEYPSILEVFPGLFIKKDELDNINNEMVKNHRHKRMTDISETVTVHVRANFESKSVTYLIEDYGYNSNHWNWHIIHRGYILRIDRKGELFWYMHHQMLARYDIERLSLGLNRVESAGPLNRILKFGYFPNLDSNENGNEWASRQDNVYPTNIRENGRVTHDIEDLPLWHTRLSKAAKDGFMIRQDGEQVILSDDIDINSGAMRGIDIFTAAVESDPLITPNNDYYGILHNHGHRIISRLHDPETRGTSLGVMANAAVGARDPSFYQWHKYVEEVIQDYKITQSPYTHQRLELSNIILSNVQITIDSETLLSNKRQNSVHISENVDSKILEDAERFNIIESELLTGCNTYGVDISGGIDFGHTQNDVIIEITHLDHIPFYYNIYVHNTRFVSKTITVRIFLAPLYGSDGRRLQLHEQQHLFIILDKIRYTLSPGENVIRRLSTESSITSNCRNSRRDSERASFRPESGVFGGGHCGCGWPHHLLLPRGTRDGMMFQMFVLLTDGDEDYVQSENKVKEFCGQRGEKHPDWQPMGYPFDRPFNKTTHFVNQLAESLSNAHVSNVSIRFTGRNILTDEFTC